MQNITSEIEKTFYYNMHIQFEISIPMWVNDCGTQYVRIVSTIYRLTDLTRF